VAVLSEGRLQQVDTPKRLHEMPANRFVAEFIGCPSMNLIPARLRTESGRIENVASAVMAIEKTNICVPMNSGLPRPRLRDLRVRSSASTHQFRTIKSVADLLLRRQYQEKCERRGVTAESFNEFPPRFTTERAKHLSENLP
jgi:ABC-type sugar transport system ATPase subunit